MTDLSRRVVLLSGAAAAGCLTLGVCGCGAPRATSADPHTINMWVSLTPDGAVTIRVNSSDIGQGAQTGIAQIVADELDADFSRVHVAMAPVTDRYMVKDEAYYTGGSSSISPQFDMYAKAGASARAMLIAAAAKRWNVRHEDCAAASGSIEHQTSGRRFSYGALAAEAATMPVPRNVMLKARAARTLIGKTMPRLDIPEKVDGRAIYGIDVMIDGMLIGTPLLCPYQNGTLAHLDSAPALAIKGVRAVIPLENGAIVLATNFWAAKKGRDALSPQWTKPPGAIADDAAMFATLRNAIDAAGAKDYAREDNVAAVRARIDAAMRSAPKRFEAAYQVQLLAHAPIEPMNATARASADGCEVWAPMQDQASMRSDVAKALNLPAERVQLHTTKVGGGFGRRLKTDYGVMAAKASKAIGAPVKVIWTREEDMTHDFYRPASACRMTAALDGAGMVTALEYSGATSCDTAVGGLIGNYPFDAIVRQNRVDMPLSIGAWRSVDPSITVFFLESFIDEVAHEQHIDPLAYRRMLLKNDARALRVLDAVAAMARWNDGTNDRHLGLAFFNARYWGTAVAIIVALRATAKRVTLTDVYCAIDPGTAVNPGQVRAQAEGGILMGLSAAFGEAITLRDGMVEQQNFDSYAPLRLADAPAIHVRVLESPEVAMGGVGEPPVPPTMPALANALFAATGDRVRHLPLKGAGYTL